MIKRIALVGTATVTALALLTASIPSDAGTTPPAGYGSAQATAVQASSGNGITLGTPTVNVIGLNLVPAGLGSLLTGALQPALTALPQQLLAAITSGLANTGLSAANGTAQQARPASGQPNCQTGGWTQSTPGTIGNCYSATNLNIATPALIGLSLGVLQGYATGDSIGYIASSQVSNIALSLLGAPILSAGVATSTAACGVASCSTPTSSVTTLAPSSPITVTVPLTSLLSLLGISLNALSSVLGLVELDDSGSTVTLTVTAGPSTVTHSTASPPNASACGLDVRVDLSLNLQLAAYLNVSVLGIGLLKTKVATITAGTTGASPNLLDLGLACSAATAGPLLPGWIAAALI